MSQSVEEVLKLAIRTEAESADFYAAWAAAATVPSTRKLLESLSLDEKFHLERVRKILEGKMSFSRDSLQQMVDTTRAGDPPAPSADADYDAVLAWAMEREKWTYGMYESLSNSTAEPEAQQTLFALADQEQRHYIRLKRERASARMDERLRRQFRGK